jgi:hypothetical protein
MKINIPNVNLHPRQLLRRCGYAEQITRHGKISYIRRIAQAEFPRFHVYVQIGDNEIQVNLHLDQKAPTYGRGTAHSGEYDGEVVAKEGERISSSLNAKINS